MNRVITQALLTGRCRHPEVMTIRGGRLASVDFPAVAMLIRHPVEGPILFDTGYAPAFLAATARFPERLYRLATPVDIPPGRDAASQCRARGIDPAEVRHVVLSHFHGDHVAGLVAFPRAAIHCSAAGLADLARGGRLSLTRRGLLPALLPADLGARARLFEDRPAVPLPADALPFETGRDLLGDGSLLAVPLPGHSPGHHGLLLADEGHGWHFLVGDAAWSLAAIRDNRPPPRITTALLGDTASTRDTLFRLHRLHARNPDLRLTPCHCAERAAALTCTPAS